MSRSAGAGVDGSAAADDVGGLPPRTTQVLVAGLPRLGSESVAELLDRMGHGRERDETERQLVEGTLWLVSELAQSGASAEVPAEDLFQEGSVALVTLVHGLDPARPLSGEELLEQIRAAVGRVMVALVAADRESREEDRLWAQDAARLSQAEAGLRLSLGANPTDHQLARRLGWPVGRVAQLRRALAEARAQSDEEFMEIVGEAASE